MLIGLMIPPPAVSRPALMTDRQKKKWFDFLTHSDMLKWHRTLGPIGELDHRERWDTEAHFITNSDVNSYHIRRILAEHKIINFNLHVYYDEGPGSQPNYLDISKSDFLIMLPNCGYTADRYRAYADKHRIPYGLIFPNEGDKF